MASLRIQLSAIFSQKFLSARETILPIASALHRLLKYERFLAL
jgi:hypothetical protein